MIKIKEISGLESFDGYEIDRNGNVYSYHIRGMNRKFNSIDWSKKPIVLSPSTKSSGYKHLALHDGNKAKYFMVHRLLAMAFIPNPRNLEQVNHIDGDKTNNSLDNLEWVSRSDNVKHAFKIGLQCHKRNGAVKPVKQFDLDGNFIKEHESITDAVNAVGLKPSSKSAITRVCKGKQNTCAGYKWEYSTPN